MRKSKVFFAFGMILLLIACVSISGCVSQLIGDAEDPVEVPVFTPVPTPTPTPIPLITSTPTPTPTPKLPGTFVGNWTRELPAKGFDETFEFKNQQSFTYRLVVKDEEDFNDNNREYTQGSHVKSGHSLMQVGIVVPLPNGKYKLKTNYYVIRNEKGQVCSERQFEYAHMVDFADLTYERDSDGLLISDEEQTTRFKRIN